MFSLTGTLPGGLGFLTDTLSGTPTVAGSFPLTAKALDANGFAATQAYTLAVTDNTAPVITGILSSNGWYTSDITVSWTVVDNESTVSSQLNCTSTSISTDTGGTTLICQATSLGDTASQTVTIQRDAAPPTLAPTVTPNPVAFNDSALASASCGTPDTSVTGDRSVSCTEPDLAGNSASANASYTMQPQHASNPVVPPPVSGAPVPANRFGGFSASVANSPQLNRVKAWDRVPFIWKVTDANGKPVTNLKGVTLTVEPLACPAARAS